MLRAGYIVSILEKLPYDTEMDFMMKARPEAEILYDKTEDTRLLCSDCEKAVIRKNGVTFLLECGM